MNENDEIRRMSNDYPNLIELGGGVDDAQIGVIENRLAMKLPSFYQSYLREFGTIRIGPDSFFGSGGGDVETGDYWNVVAAKEMLTKDWDFPRNLVPVLDEEGDSYLCVDVTSGGEELVRWFPRNKSIFRTGRKFWAFLHQICREMVEDAGDDQDDVE